MIDLKNRSAEAELPKTMQAAVLQEPFHVTLEERPLPDLDDDEVLVKVMAVGVCGSDVHFYEHGRIGKCIADKPIILGHECAGIIVATGHRVSKFQIGDRVAVEPGVTCGRCEACKGGRYNLCPDVQFLATPPYDGAFVQYFKHREDFIFPIPDELSFEEAAFNEPFSVGIHAARMTGLQPGSTVVIMGMGPVGLMAVAACKSFGVSTIIVADMEEIRLQAAVKLGATHTIQVKDIDPAEEVRRITSGVGADAAFETAGNEHALRAAVMSVKRGGKCALVGLPPKPEASLYIPYIVDNEIQIQGIFRYANTYPLGIKFLSAGEIQLQPLITDKYTLEQTAEALERARTNKSGSLKVMVYPNGF
jgi:L-iditol 2-dehydrogenase